ncbi:uncharacterized protein LOC127808074 isoform X2 [Diospyros lotus]|uniref:uncharacterized protein LOC127808074 isoform X2 n=1 Tax=Diospyros lotus TaxID=55363 RepID=UPI0022596AD6|nr:uncharacterized protein LOC127808074 isoform X2 [Diospyros lotus]
MESNTLSPSPDKADAKATFHKPSNDAANRRYRRRSPVGGSSSSGGSPTDERSTSPVHSREEDSARDSDRRRKKDDERDLDRDSSRNPHGRSGDSYRHFNEHSSRGSRSYHKRDDYSRRDRNMDEERNYSRTSSRYGRELRVGSHSDYSRRETEHYRSRDLSRGTEKYSRDRSDGSVHRGRDKERETSSLEYQKYKDKESLSDRTKSSRKYSDLNAEDIRYGEQDKHGGEGDGQDEKRDYRRDNGAHRLKEASRSGHRELDGQRYTKDEKKKYDDRETSRHKDHNDRKQGEQDLTSENLESAAKKPKSSMGTDYGKDVPKLTTAADESQTSSSKQAQELAGKVTPEQASAKCSEAVPDIDAAKVAAMKAAELVNRNLIGTGYMSTDQKKKLLWGKKKDAAAEESGHHWDSAMFSDREQQEKFKKLMSLRLHWYLWPIVGCEGRAENGKQTGESRKQWPPSREAEGNAAGFGEAIHCRTSSKRWPNCRTRSLRTPLGYFPSFTVRFAYILLHDAIILSSLIILGRGNCVLPSRFAVLVHGKNVAAAVYIWYLSSQCWMVISLLAANASTLGLHLSS